ncbi:hypothetical protein BTL55_02110 [Bordetella trematum]|nr:hypothetical protein BTL55_02110 [Bordetella trematum]
MPPHRSLRLRQSVKQAGKDEKDVQRLANDAKDVAETRTLMIVLEHIPESLAQHVITSISALTIGTRVNTACDVLFLVINDAIDMSEK